MINFHRVNSKMANLRNFLIFCLCIVAANADSKFYVLNTPNSLQFTGSEALKSSQLDTVALAATGNSIAEATSWSGLLIKDPFELPSLAVVVHIDGAENLQLVAPQHTYSVSGNEAGPSLATLKENANAACDVNFNQLDALIELKACLPSIVVPAVTSTGALDASNTEDQDALTAIATINALAENLDVISEVKFIVLRYSVETLKQNNAAGATEALELLAKAIDNLNAKIAAAKSNNVVMFAVATSETQIARKKREVIQGTPNENPLNLAVYYDQNYPAIFNIILWFMVVFGFSLLAICYAIGDMDPGRDSIIYRMTSTRMKKDN